MTHVRRLSPRTVEAYTHDVGGFLGFLQQHRGEAVDLDALKDVSASDVRGWLATRREDGLGPRGVARAVSALRTFFIFLQKQGLVENLSRPARAAAEVAAGRAEAGVDRRRAIFA